MSVLMIDNYDSFTFNVVQYLGELGADVEVYRNDAITLDEIASKAPDCIVISPGPGTPRDAGISMEVIRQFAGQIPLLGICLGHQSLAEVFGGQVVRARQVMHGKTSLVHHNRQGVFAGLPSPFTATRYHSLVAREVPDILEVTAWTLDDNGERDEIMGLRHRGFTSNATAGAVPGTVFGAVLEGVQFHPEAILTEHGHALLANFLNAAKSSAKP